MRSNNTSNCCLLISVIVIFCFSFSGISYSQKTTSFKEKVCVENEVLVRFTVVTGEFSSQARQKFRSRFIQSHNIRVLNRWSGGMEHWQLGHNDLEPVLDSLNTNPHILYAEPNYILYADLIPTDPDFDLQWGLYNSGQTGGMSDADIDATEAWDISTGHEEILVGIIDSGIDYTHPDLASNIWINSGEIAGNGLDDDNNGFIDDYHGYDFLNEIGDPVDEHGHGTHISGIIGAIGDNGIGVSGVAWNVQLLPLKFLGSDNSGPTSAAISAIEYAIDAGVDFINASWGNTVFSQSLADAVQLAEESGILFIASAGNTSSDNDFLPHYPSDLEFENIISVASSDQNDLISDFSNWGLTSVDLVAPGTEIYSTLPDTSYGMMSGTSMATPFVTGALVLTYAVFPQMTPLQLKEQILGSVDFKEELIGLVTSAGRLNAANAVGSDLLPALSLEPAYIDFGIELIGQTSEINTIDIVNFSEQVVTVDSIIVGSGYQIDHDNGFSQIVGPFQIEPGEGDSIQVRFLPLVVQEYNQLLTFYYQTSPESPKSIVLQLLGSGVTGTILSGGPVSGTWYKNESPYYIEGDIYIPADNSLMIEPGTAIQFQGHYSFTIGESASLEARGSVNDSIVFTAGDTRIGWNGIRLLNSGNDDILNFCRLEYGMKSSSGVNLEDQRGGAIYCQDSDPLIENCIIQHNQASGGGGLCLSGSDATLNDVTIRFNDAGLDGGGGISFYDSNPSLFRVIISHNTSINWFQSGDNGGGIYCRASSPQMLNVTVSQNFADRGGGIYITQSSENVTIVNSIFWGNIPNEIEFSADSKDKSIAIGFSDIEGGAGSIDTPTSSSVFYLDGNFSANPQFLNEEAADFRLGGNSPCIDSGIRDTTIFYNEEQGMIIVPVLSYNNTAPDMGAIESSETPLYTISLNSGWNLIGWNVETEVQAPEQRFSDVLENLDVALSFENVGLTYDPLVDDLFNNLKITDHFHGYWLRMNAADHLVLSGTPVQLPASVFLEQGWNLISYLPQYSDSIHLALENILDNVVIVEAFDDGALTFDPTLPDSINTLNILTPGYGYWIKTMSNDTLTFNDKDIAGAEGQSLAELNDMYLPSEELIPTHEWISVFATSILLSGESIDEDIKLTAYDPDGNICGEIKVNENGSIKMMPVYRDDIRTADIDEGAEPGDSISFYINNQPIRQKLVWQSSGQIEDISDFIVGINDTQTLIKPLFYFLKQNYPNPFNSRCVIPFQIPIPGKVSIEVYNILGQKVRTLVDIYKKPGSYQIEWDGKNDSDKSLSSGIYFCMMVAGDFKTIIKMILLN